jgi:hypothetical protein
LATVNNDTYSLAYYAGSGKCAPSEYIGPTLNGISSFFFTLYFNTINVTGKLGVCAEMQGDYVYASVVKIPVAPVANLTVQTSVYRNCNMSDLVFRQVDNYKYCGMEFPGVL